MQQENDFDDPECNECSCPVCGSERIQVLGGRIYCYECQCSYDVEDESE